MPQKIRVKGQSVRCFPSYMKQEYAEQAPTEGGGKGKKPLALKRI